MWYYVEDGEQRGPVMEADLETLRRDGKVNQDTLVWREGMAQWQALREVQPSAGSPTPAATAVASGTSGAEVICSECQGRFPASEVIRYGSTWVCAACKPIFVQKLKEGANVAGGPMEYATFWMRFVAYFVDGIITRIMGGIVGVLLGLALGAAGARGPAGVLAIQVVSMLVGFGISATYFIYFIGKTGQTPGKRLCKIKVVNADGSQVGYGKAAGRFFGYMLSGLILFIGFLMAAWDDEHRALHDRLCDTRVIKV